MSSVKQVWIWKKEDYLDAAFAVFERRLNEFEA